MVQTTINYVKVLYELKISVETVHETLDILRQTDEIGAVLENPLIDRETKDRVIERIFPKEIQNFIKVAKNHGKTSLLPEMLEGYEEYRKKCEDILTARLIYVTKPTVRQMEEMEQFLCSRYGKKQAVLDLVQDPSLLGGFILQADGHEYDWSLRARYQRLGEKLLRR